MYPWIAIALLAGSWLLGAPYYHQPNLVAWAVVGAAAVALLAFVPGRAPSRRLAVIATVLSLPALAIAFWPHAYLWKDFLTSGDIGRLFDGGLSWPGRLAISLFCLGMLLAAVLPARRWANRLSGALTLAGVVLLVQGTALEGYEALTARSHDLPAFVGPLVAGPARLLGVDCGQHQSTLVVMSMRETHSLGLTWELLVDPVSVLFVVGALVWLAWCVVAVEPAGPRPLRTWLWAALGLLLVMVVWLPLRAGLVIALFLHDVLRTEYEAPITAMRIFWNPWIHLLALVPPALLAWRFLGRRESSPAVEAVAAPAATPAVSQRLPLWAGALAILGAAAVSAAFFFEPTGTAKPGRVLIEEYAGDPDRIDDWVWERTDRPYDTEWYGHMAGYNYYCIADYTRRFYDVERLTTPLSDVALADCDVLILKTPKRAYSDAEIEAVLRYVEAGGGLLLVGEHTDVYLTGRNLNALARRLGFEFRYDCLFGVDRVFEQRYDLPLVPHPAVQHLPGLHFATSCSLAPGATVGRAAIRSTGLKNRWADYHVDNYYPSPSDRADMRYGAFTQLWAQHYGRGRVLAFTDSTIFSNFCAFEPGKAELWLGMIQWLNHRGGWPSARWWLLGLGALLLAGAVLMVPRGGWRQPAVLVAALVCGWAAAVLAVRTLHASTMPPPVAEQQRPMVRVAMDRVVSTGKLPRNGFTEGLDTGFGLFERWLLRLGYFTNRPPRADEFENDLVVFAHPGKAPSPGFIAELKAYVDAGGKVLVLDSAANQSSHSAALLEPFGLVVDTRKPLGGALETPDGWPGVPVERAVEIKGGHTLARVDGKPVAAWTRGTQGRGLVAAIGFGQRFSDREMGITGDIEPDEAMRRVYELQFTLLRAMIEKDELPAM